MERLSSSRRRSITARCTLFENGVLEGEVGANEGYAGTHASATLGVEVIASAGEKIGNTLA
jgi:hypothetical protein